MDLILTEKPSVAADFAKALGAARAEGHFAGKDLVITYCFGHMFELADPEDYDPALKTWRTETLPILPPRFEKKPIKTAGQQLAKIRPLLAKADRVILATDAGREGELIGREVLEWAGYSGPVLRFWSSEALTPEVIRANLALLRPSADYQALYDQGLRRQWADWIVGINFTRFYSVRLKSTYSVGRVQTAVLAILCRRETEIQRFSPSSFFTMSADFLSDGIKFSGQYFVPSSESRQTRFPSASALESARDQIAPPAHAAVTEISTETKTENPPALFSLTALQQAANKAFGFSANKTLDLAQRLYEEFKILSYPRTPSRVLGASSVSLADKILAKLSTAYPALFSGVDPGLVSASNKAVFDDSKLEDHHALIPLAPAPEGLPEAEGKLFSLVVRSFAAAFSPPAIYSVTKATLSSVGHLFQVSGKSVVQVGWKAAYTPPEEEPQEGQVPENAENATLPTLTQGQVVPLTALTIKQGKTTAPKRFSEAEVLGFMEKPARFFSEDFLDDGSVAPGLGTPATRASIIETLLGREYIERKKRLLVPAQKGRFLIDVLSSGKAASLTQPEETARWEQALSSSPQDFFSGVFSFVQTTFAGLTSSQAQELPQAPSSIGNCPKCGSPILEKQAFWLCSKNTLVDGSPCDMILRKVLLKATLTASDAKSLFSGKKSAEKTFTSTKTGEKFEAFIEFEKSGKLKFTFRQTP